MTGEHHIARRKPCFSTLLSPTNLTKSALWSNSGLHSEDCQCKEAARWIIVNHTAEMMWGESVSLKAQSRNLPEGCEQDQGNVRHVSSSLLWYSTPGLPHTRPKWNQPTPRFCISKIWVHKCCPCVYALRQEECRQRSTYSSPLYLLDLGHRFTLVPTYCLQKRETLGAPQPTDLLGTVSSNRLQLLPHAIFCVFLPLVRLVLMTWEYSYRFAEALVTIFDTVRCDRFSWNIAFYDETWQLEASGPSEERTRTKY
jgi:hypothetical protein